MMNLLSLPCCGPWCRPPDLRRRMPSPMQPDGSSRCEAKSPCLRCIRKAGISTVDLSRETWRRFLCRPCQILSRALLSMRPREILSRFLARSGRESSVGGDLLKVWSGEVWSRFLRYSGRNSCVDLVRNRDAGGPDDSQFWAVMRRHEAWKS